MKRKQIVKKYQGRKYYGKRKHTKKNSHQLYFILFFFLLCLEERTCSFELRRWYKKIINFVFPFFKQLYFQRFTQSLNC